jgi:uncharacterized protein YbjT (DUF2867 family)
MFTIFGANGNTGSVVAKTLLAKGEKVRIVRRDTSKAAALGLTGAEVVKGDVLDRASVESALRGAEGAYLLVPPDNASKDFLARARIIADNYAAALEKQPVSHVVLLSSVGAHLPSGTGPIVSAHLVEQALSKLTKTKHTFLRAAYFMENILAYAGAMKGDGVLPVFGGGEGYPFDMVATKDIGRTAAEALLARPSSSGIIELAGPKPYSFEDAAREASQILGRSVKAQALPIEGMVPALTSFGFSENVAGLFREMTEAFGAGRVQWTQEPKRGTTSLRDLFASALA